MAASIWAFISALTAPDSPLAGVSRAGAGGAGAGVFAS
jgi:hypothetical protein